ncbi:DUF6731 family protein [Hydrogenophaga bisanensis]|uniref:DUF6731 family protein n=1 Tax=Hydrogenophaga bisanensis TaxID=439611 RepID=A0ABW2R767_9BURK
MKVHAYKVEFADGSQPLEEVLQQIENEQSLRERIRLINQVELRVESITQLDGLWLMDFVRIRTSHGPGKVGRDSEVEGFEFEEEEGFGEETAALYDPTTGYILIQYNHFGVRGGAIADYFSAYDGTENNLYTFKPKYDEDVERRLINHGITRKISFCLDVTRMSEQDRQRGRPLSEAIDYGRQNGADKIKVEISVHGERNRSLAQGALDGLAALRSILGQNPDAVTKLEVSGKENQDSVTEVLDLIAHRLSVEFNDLVLGADLRYPRDERWRALIRAKNGWRQMLR